MFGTYGFTTQTITSQRGGRFFRHGKGERVYIIARYAGGGVAIQFDDGSTASVADSYVR